MLGSLKAKKHQKMIALTGTPGTGKTSICHAVMLRTPASKQRPSFEEVSDLALRLRCGRMVRGAGRPCVSVDIGALTRKLREHMDGEVYTVLVGHLSHLLPVDEIILLRCNPSELERRLRARGDSEGSISQNADAERIDLILLEAIESGKPIYEHDTTDEVPDASAKWVMRVLKGAVKPSYGKIDWLKLSPPMSAGRAGA